MSSKKTKTTHDLDSVVIWPVDDFLDYKNHNLKKTRIKEISIAVLKTWITRYVLNDSLDKYFEIELLIDSNEIEARFNNEVYASRCEILFEQIRDNGFPTRDYWS